MHQPLVLDGATTLRGEFLSLTLSGLGYFGQKTSFSNAGHKTVKNHENKKNNGTFTLTTLKVDGVKVVLFFLFSNV